MGAIDATATATTTAASAATAAAVANVATTAEGSKPDAAEAAAEGALRNEPGVGAAGGAARASQLLTSEPLPYDEVREA